jgi:phosphoribosylaminoimidazolecarboxamide formyltransferase/IMP cyclohydrolase
MADVKVSRALISVYNKDGIDKLVACLNRLNVEIISSGGTAKAIRKLGYSCTDVSDYTGYPESPDDLVKTLHPKIHGGLLMSPTKPAHKKYMEEQSIPPFDLAAVNLYPFSDAAAKPDATEEEVYKMIDIGGPAMVRASGKGDLLHGRPCVVVDPADYKIVIAELDKNGCIPLDVAKELTIKAFEHTAAYDAEIVRYLRAKIRKVA